MSTFSTFLFARPSFAEGIGRVLDFGNTLQEYNESATPQLADFCAFVADWNAVGAEILIAIDALHNHHHGPQNVQERTKKNKAVTKASS